MASPAGRSQILIGALALTVACGTIQGNTARSVVIDRCGRYLDDSTTGSTTFLIPADSIGAFRACWYSVFLEAFHEPDLRITPLSSPDLYRFLWLPTFSQPVSIRIESHEAGGGTVVLVAGSGAGGYEPGKVVRRDSLSITASEWAQLTDGVAAAQLWSMSAAGGRQGLDGSSWLIEGVRGGHYHLVDRWTPPDTSAYYRLGVRMMKLAGLPTDSTRIY